MINTNTITGGYFRVGKAEDINNKVDRAIYRSLEMLPGMLAWGTLFTVVLLSWKNPVLIAIFIISFVVYWFVRSIYLHIHLRFAYRKMRENENIDWLRMLQKRSIDVSRHLKNVRDWQDIYHLIVLPMYKEPLKIVRQSLSSLLKTDYPTDRMIVVVGCEESQAEATRETADIIEKEFKDKFFRFLITWHPKGLQGEIPGHGSNETWATKKAKELIIDPLKIPYENIIVSSFDVDTQVAPKYFSCLTWHYLTCDNPTRTSFQPVPLYINNIWEAPIFSQVFSFAITFWHTMNQERPDKLISFSSHAIPFKALVDVGFKQTNVVSDDSRIFWQCFFYYNGEYKVQPLYYPVSMDANVSKNFLRTTINIYRQQRRWAYGAAEIPYIIFGFLKNKKIAFTKKISIGVEVISEHFSWAVAPILIFLLGWLPSSLGSGNFSQSVISYNLPRNISLILTVGMLGLVISAHLSILLLPPKPLNVGSSKYIIFALGWLLIPIMMIFFSALPALDAQTRLMLAKYMGFWPTEKVRHYS